MLEAILLVPTNLFVILSTSFSKLFLTDALKHFAIMSAIFLSVDTFTAFTFFLHAVHWSFATTSAVSWSQRAFANYTLGTSCPIWHRDNQLRRCTEKVETCLKVGAKRRRQWLRYVLYCRWGYADFPKRLVVYIPSSRRIPQCCTVCRCPSLVPWTLTYPNSNPYPNF